MAKDRMEIRIESGLKETYKEAATKLGYKDLTDFVLNLLNREILQNPDTMSDLSNKVIIEADRERKKKKIRYLQKRNRSDAFQTPRFIEILRKYEKEQNFIPNEYLIREFKFFIDWAKTTDNPEAQLRAIYPEVNNKWPQGKQLIEAELIALGLNPDQINKIYTPTNSIGSEKKRLMRQAEYVKC